MFEIEKEQLEKSGVKFSIIGNCLLINDDCLKIMPTLGKVDAVLRVLNDHMAALAKTNKVAQFIGRCGCFKKPERFFMMDWNTGSNENTASLACSSVSLNGIFSRNLPPLTAICGDPPNVKRGFFARFIIGHKLSVAGLAAKTQTRFCFVLPLKPRFYFKGFFALSAIMGFSLNGIKSFYLFTCKGISWPHSLAPFIANLMSVRHFSCGQVPSSSAFLAAKSSGFLPIIGHLK